MLFTLYQLAIGGAYLCASLPSGFIGGNTSANPAEADQLTLMNRAPDVLAAAARGQLPIMNKSLHHPAGDSWNLIRQIAPDAIFTILD